MKTKFLLKGASFLFLVLLAFFGMNSCKSDKKQSNEVQVEPEPETENVIEIVTEAMEFQMPDTIPSGWNTWRYVNKSTQPHFILIDDYPDGITRDSLEQRVFPIFGNGMTLINEGKTEEGFEEFAKLPKWFSEVKWPGGVGLISSGKTAETTLKLEPGNYFIECYVKMNTGMFHTNMGMIKAIVVSEEKSTLEEPTADVSIDISSKEGIAVNPPAKAGTYTFSVNYIDQTTYENFMGHDINLVKLDDGAVQNALETWMDWSNPKGLIEPAPEKITFLGGVNDMPAGSKGYFTATLEPGKYALISEVPNASEKGLLKTFVVSE